MKSVICNTCVQQMTVMMNTARLAIFVQKDLLVERRNVFSTICVKMKNVKVLKVARRFMQFSSPNQWKKARKLKEEKGIENNFLIKVIVRILPTTWKRKIKRVILKANPTKEEEEGRKSWKRTKSRNEEAEDRKKTRRILPRIEEIKGENLGKPHLTQRKQTQIVIVMNIRAKKILGKSLIIRTIIRIRIVISIKDKTPNNSTTSTTSRSRKRMLKNQVTGNQKEIIIILWQTTKCRIRLKFKQVI